MGKPAIINDRVKDAAKLVDAVYGFSGVGGNAHNVVDDWNLGDSHIRWCLDTAIPENHHEADTEQLKAERECLEALLNLSEDERGTVLAINDGLIAV